MLTKDQILKASVGHELSKPETTRRKWAALDFYAGATWANEQNAAEIAELADKDAEIERLKKIEQQYIECIFDLNRALKEKVDAEYDNAAKDAEIAELLAFVRNFHNYIHIGDYVWIDLLNDADQILAKYPE